MTGGARRARRGLVACVVAFAVVACGGDVPGTIAAPGGERAVPVARTDGEWRPGDGLLERLDGARLLAAPAHALPPDVAETLGGPVRVEVPMPPLAWQRAEAMPPEWVATLEAHGRGDLWWARPPLPLVEGAPEPVARVDGRDVPRWSFGDAAPVPERFAGWYRGQHMVLAVSEGPPRGVSLVGSVPAVAEFARVERGRALTGHEPAPADLRTRATLDDVTRDAVLLAAPSVLELPAGVLRADRLHVAVGVSPEGWTIEDGVVRRAPRRGDGATFAVEVVVEGRAGGGAVDGAGGAPDSGSATATVERVWSATVGADDVGEAWTEAVVDLARFRGRRVALRLVTEPGPAGDALHDYGLWADLRLRGGAARVPDRPHVVLVDVDTLRADRLAAYGAARATTPALDAWAAERAVVYTDSVSTAPWTLPSTVSFLTGLAVHQHGVDRASAALGDTATTLASRLADAGYETRALTGGGYLRPVYGCDAGFERYDTRDPKDLDWSAALDFVAARDSERPVFLFLHTYAVHAPYERTDRWTDPAYAGPLRDLEVDTHNVLDPCNRGELSLDPADAAWVEALYDGLVTGMDAHVAAFLRELEARVGDEPLLVLFTSDHGEGFLEHGHLGHGASLHAEQLRVPLVVRYPDARPGASDVPVSGLDLVPTVLDVVGLPVPDDLPGRSLRAHRGTTPTEGGDARSGGREPRGAAVDTARPDVRVAESDDRRAVLSDGTKLIGPRTDDAASPASLYDLTDDPGEHEDVAAVRPDDVAELRRRLAWFLGRYTAPEGGHAVGSDAAGAALAELKALGYLGDG